MSYFIRDRGKDRVVNHPGNNKPVEFESYKESREYLEDLESLEPDSAFNIIRKEPV